MRIARITAAGVAAAGFIVFAFLCLTGRLVWLRHCDLSGAIARAARYHVTIIRDTYGIPHVEGKTDADVAFGVGYAHSEDDFKTIQEVVMAVRGRLAESEGLKAAPGDYLVHLMRVWPTIRARYKKELPASFRAILQAYADGVNYYAALHPAEVKRDFQPVTGEDVAAGFMFKTPLFYGFQTTLRRLMQKTGGKPLPEIGSNGVAVAPVRSADGATRLLINSHQPYTGPVAWYEVVVQSQQGWHMAGGLFPGSPFVLHGFNAHLGWANTVNDPDLVDIYRLKINPKNANQYWLDGRWHNLKVEEAAIRVKLWGPIVWTAYRPVYFAAQGPVLKTDHGTFAIRYAGMGEVRQALEYYRLDKSRNLDQWRAALAMGALPSINYIYADAKGNIGFVYNGEFPVRKPGINWQGYIDGTRSDLIWHHYLPFSKVPQIWNPKSGFVFNSNNTPFVATAPQDDLKPADFPKWMGIQTNMTNRAWRALKNFGGDSSITAAAFRRFKYDLAYSRHSEFMADVEKLIAMPAHGDADMLHAQQILRHWDRMTNIADRGTALAVLTIAPVMRAEWDHLKPVSLAASFHRAIVILKTHFGRLDPEWGQVNRIIRGNINLPIDGGPDTYRAVYGKLQKNGTLRAYDGDTLIIFVTWDKNGQVSARSISPYGATESHPHSPHYNDQTRMFVAMKTKPVWFTNAELKGHIEAEYAPGQPHKP